MALNCKLSERIFTFEGKDYSYAQFQALLAEGLLAKIPQLTQQAKAAITAPTAEPAPKGAVDASDIDAMEGLMSRHEGNNAEGVSKPKLIAKVLNGIRWLTNNKLGYDANTGKGNRIFVAESKAEYERITKDASGKAKTGGGVAIPRYDADGNYMGADIYINLDTKSLGTVAHELAHVALMEKFAGDPKLFKKFVAAIKPFTSAKDLAHLDKFIRLYSNEEVRPEEFLAEMTALIEERFASGEVDAKELSALRKLAEAIKQFINKLTGGLVFPLEKESDVRAFFNALGQSIAVGGVMKEGLAEAAAKEVGAKPEAAERREAVERKEKDKISEEEIVKSESGKVSVVVSSKPGKSFVLEQDKKGAIVSYPKGGNSQLYIDRLHQRVDLILNSSAASNFLENISGFKEESTKSKISIQGLWNGEIENTFVITPLSEDGSQVSFNDARKFANLLGFAFLQEAVVTYQPSPKDNVGIPSVVIRRPDGKTISRKEVRNVLSLASKEGFYGASEAANGAGIKFFFFPDDASGKSEADQYQDFLTQVQKVQQASGLTDWVNFGTNSQLDNADGYWKQVTGTDLQGDSGADGLQDGETGRPDLFRGTVDNVLAPYISALKTEGFEFNAKNWQKAFGATDKQRKYLERRIKYFDDVNKHGVVKKLRQTVDISKEKEVGVKAVIGQNTTNKNALKQLSALDKVLSLSKNATESVTNWLRMQAIAYGTNDVPMAPARFIEMINGDGVYNQLKTLSPGQVSDAEHGFEMGEEFRKLYTSGKVPPSTTAKLMMWSFLSRGVSPYVQESAFVDLVSSLGPFVDKVVNGTFTKSDAEAWNEIVSDTIKKGTGQPGAGTTHNANAFGGSFMAKMSGIGPDGKTRMQALHDLFSDPKKTGKEIRREFLKMSQGVGIDNKVMSFTLLVIGHPDVAVFDRVQIDNTFNNGSLGDYNLYDGIGRHGYYSEKPVLDKEGNPVLTKNGKPKKEKIYTWLGSSKEDQLKVQEIVDDSNGSLTAVSGKLPGSGLADLTTGVRGLLLYEPIESVLKEKLPAIFDRLIREGLRPKGTKATPGRWHWESWVAHSGQEASHKTLEALLNEVKGQKNPFADVSAKEGEYGSYAYGTEYAIDKDGNRYKIYPDSKGNQYKFTLDQYTKMINEVKKKGKNSVAPSSFKVSTNEDGSNRTQPWYEDNRVNKEKLDEIVSSSGKLVKQETKPRREAMERKEDEAFNGIEEPKTPIGDTKTVIVDGKERTVFNSEGRPIHPTVEGVRNFWRWFGDSKVVDAKNRPLVVYHGTHADVDEFRLDPIKVGLYGDGTYATPYIGEAESYAKYEGGNVMPLYVRLQNPLILDRDSKEFGSFVFGDNIGGRISIPNGLIITKKGSPHGGIEMVISPNASDFKSATGNYGRFDPKRREIMERKEGVRDIPADADPETRELLTVVRRRVEKLEGDEKRAKERDVLLGRPANYIEPGDYKAAVDQARDFVAEMYFKYADLPLSKWGKAVYNEIQSITNEASRVVAFGELHAALDMAADSRKISAKDRKEIADLAAKIVGEMATEARKMGQANAALAIVYSQFGKFSSLVQAEKINQEFKAKLQTTPGSEPGKSIADNIQEARDEVNEFINKDGNEDLADVIDVAEEVNDAMEDIHAEQVAAGKSTPLDAPDPVSAFDFIDNSAIYGEIISELEEELARLNGKLSIVTKLYGQATQQASAYAKQIADLRSEMAKREKLIERLKKQKEKISKERDKYKAKAETLKQKVADLKNINKLLAASKLSTQRKNKLINELIELAASGKLNDPDFDSVFAAITKNNYLTTQDRKAIEHMAKAMKYFEKTGQTELGQKYAKRLNEYLANVSKEPWNAAKVAMLLQAWFYNAVLSSIGTLQNAFVGSILVTVPNATAASIATALKNPKSGLGATLYGMMRMLKEMPTAISKGTFNQRAYDSMGTSWTVDNASTYADPFEVHILNGFFKHWDRIKNDPSAVEKMKASVALLGSMVAQATRIVGLLKFIDPVLRHSVAAHLEGMRDYIRIKEELRLQKDTDPSIAEAWTPYFSISLINKIDEMAKVSREDRSNAAKQAAEEIEQMESEGISIPKDYARRRTSEIMRAKRDQEQALVADKMAADMTMMWRPDGVLGYVWDSTSKSMSIRETDKPLPAIMKLLANLTFLPFLRISAQGVSEIQSTIPLFGSLMAAYGVAKNNEGGWYVGYKGAKNVNDREFEMQRMARRIVLNGISTLIIGGLLTHMFEIEAADDDDDEAYDLFGNKVKIKLNPDRLVDFTADARGPKSKNEGIMEGRANFSLRVRPNSKSDFSDYVSVRLAPHMTIPVAWLGRLSDDVNRLYAQPAFGKGEQPERAAAYDYFVNQPLTALGEVSFATIPRFYNTMKYDAGAAVARMLMSPVAAIAQPSIYRDVVSTTASMAGATKRGEYMPEGFAETSKALFTTMYGLNYMVSPEMTDEYGLPLKAVDPIRNWWKGFTDIEKRSDDYPEVNLRYRYGNTFTPATPRAQRLESVDRIVKKGEKGLIAPKLELTKEQQQESSMMSKAFYRYMTLKNYDKIVSAAEMAKKRKGKGAFPGEIVGEALEKIHNKSIGQTEKMFTLYANDKKSRDEIVNLINKLNSKSDSMSAKIKERGPLPSPENMVQLYKGDAIEIDFELE